MIICVFWFFDRTPISRERDCYGLAENSEISGVRQVFGLRQRFDHFDHGGPVQTAGTVREESPPIKAGHWRTIPHFETTCTRFNTSTRRRTYSSAGPERSQQLQILPSLNSKALLQRVHLLFLLRQHFYGRQCFPRHRVFTRRQRLWMRQVFGIRLIFWMRQVLSIRLIFWMRQVFSIRQVFARRQCFINICGAYVFSISFCILIWYAPII